MLRSRISAQQADNGSHRLLTIRKLLFLGIGRIAEKPVVKNGEIVAAPVLALSLSFDHRVIDGATAQQCA